MQTITTKYAGPTDHRGSRIVATSASGHRISISYDSSLNSEDAHKKGAIALREKLGWSKPMVGGHTKEGMVWVFDTGDYRIE